MTYLRPSFIQDLLVDLEQPPSELIHFNGALSKECHVINTENHLIKIMSAKDSLKECEKFILYTMLLAETTKRRVCYHFQRLICYLVRASCRNSESWLILSTSVLKCVCTARAWRNRSFGTGDGKSVNGAQVTN